MADDPARPALHLDPGLRVHQRAVRLQEQHLRRHLLHGDRLPRRARHHRHDLPRRLPGAGLSRPLHAASSTSASRRRPGTGTSSTSSGCSSSPASTSGGTPAAIMEGTAARSSGDGRGQGALSAAKSDRRTGLRGRLSALRARAALRRVPELAPRCSACGLDYAFADSADGPAEFVILIVGFVIAGAALLVEIRFSPPIWVHRRVWGPLVLVLCLGMLRPLKGVLVALQYHHRAAEGRIDTPTEMSRSPPSRADPAGGPGALCACRARLARQLADAPARLEGGPDRADERAAEMPSRSTFARTGSARSATSPRSSTANEYRPVLLRANTSRRAKCGSSPSLADPRSGRSAARASGS